MKINDREYVFKKPTLGLLATAAKIAQSASVFNDNWFEALSDQARFDRMKREWNKYCELIFESVDESLSLENLTPEEVAKIPTAFFMKAVMGNESAQFSNCSNDTQAAAQV